MSRSGRDEWDEDSSDPGYKRQRRKRRASSSGEYQAARLRQAARAESDPAELATPAERNARAERAARAARAIQLAPARGAERGLWTRFRRWLGTLIRGPERLALPPAPSAQPWLEHVDRLPRDQRRALDKLPLDLPETVVRVLGDAVEDYAHLQELISRGALATSPVDASTLELEGQAALADLVERSTAVAAVVSLAERRPDDAAAREAGSQALESLRSSGRALHETTSAAIQYAATLNDEDATCLELQAEELHLLVAAHQELDAEL